MRPHTLVLSLALIHLTFSPAEAARRRPVDGSPSRIAAAAASVIQPMLDAGVPGASVAVLHRGEIVYAAGFGRQSRSTPASDVAPMTVHQVGSVTKQFTAAAIMRLVEEGKLALDDRVTKYLPELNDRGTPMTIRHLLTHTGGLPEYTTRLENPYAPFAPADFFAIVNGGALQFEPGSRFVYNNSGYYALSLVVARVAQRSFDTFVALELAAPAQLTSTGSCNGFAAPSTPTGSAYFGGEWIVAPPIHESIAAGAGDLCSTAIDLVRWSRALASGAVVSRESYATMTTPLRLNSGMPVEYGFGLATHHKLGRPAVSHNGSIFGYQAQLAYYPNDDLAVAVLINAGPTPASVVLYVAEETIAAAALAGAARNKEAGLTARP